MENKAPWEMIYKLWIIYSNHNPTIMWYWIESVPDFHIVYFDLKKFYKNSIIKLYFPIRVIINSKWNETVCHIFSLLQGEYIGYIHFYTFWDVTSKDEKWLLGKVYATTESTSIFCNVKCLYGTKIAEIL